MLSTVARVNLNEVKKMMKDLDKEPLEDKKLLKIQLLFERTLDILIAEAGGKL